MGNGNGKSLESWIWDAACSIRGAKDAAKFKEFILPLIFTKRLCDVFDDELNRIAEEVGSRPKAFKLVKHDKKLVRFYLPVEPKNPDDAVWSVIRTLSDKIGEQLTTHMRAIADANPLLKGIIDRVDFNATTHGQRDIDDDRLSNLIEAISAKRLGLKDVEADIIGRSYEYLIRKFAEGSGQSAGEFYTPAEVGLVMARIMNPEPGMEIYDPCCGSAGLLIKCRLVVDDKLKASKKRDAAPLRLFGQENEAGTWAMANMNMIIHDMEGEIQIGDTFRKPKFREGKERMKKVAQYVADHYRENVEPLGYKAFLVGVDREACALYKEALDAILPPEYSEIVYTGTNNDSPRHSPSTRIGNVAKPSCASCEIRSPLRYAVIEGSEKLRCCSAKAISEFGRGDAGKYQSWGSCPERPSE